MSSGRCRSIRPHYLAILCYRLCYSHHMQKALSKDFTKKRRDGQLPLTPSLTGCCYDVASDDLGRGVPHSARTTQPNTSLAEARTLISTAQVRTSRSSSIAPNQDLFLPQPDMQHAHVTTPRRLCAILLDSDLRVATGDRDPPAGSLRGYPLLKPYISSPGSRVS